MNMCNNSAEFATPVSRTQKPTQHDLFRNTYLGTLACLPLEIRQEIWKEMIEDEKQLVINYHKKTYRFSRFEVRLEVQDDDIVFMTDVSSKIGNFSNIPPPRSFLGHVRTLSRIIEGEVMQLLELSLARQEAKKSQQIQQTLHEDDSKGCLDSQNN